MQPIILEFPLEYHRCDSSESTDIIRYPQFWSEIQHFRRITFGDASGERPGLASAPAMARSSRRGRRRERPCGARRDGADVAGAGAPGVWRAGGRTGTGEGTHQWPGRVWVVFCRWIFCVFGCFLPLNDIVFVFFCLNVWYCLMVDDSSMVFLSCVFYRRCFFFGGIGMDWRPRIWTPTGGWTTRCGCGESKLTRPGNLLQFAIENGDL